MPALMRQRTARDGRGGVEVHTVPSGIAYSATAERRLCAEDTDEVFRYSGWVDAEALRVQPFFAGVAGVWLVDHTGGM